MIKLRTNGGRSIKTIINEADFQALVAEVFEKSGAAHHPLAARCAAAGVSHPRQEFRHLVPVGMAYAVTASVSLADGDPDDAVWNAMQAALHIGFEYAQSLYRRIYAEPETERLRHLCAW